MQPAEPEDSTVNPNLPIGCDALRPSKAIFKADDRSGGTLDEHAARIHAIYLHASVPQEVQVMFDTARNLALYAWFVYRFIPVAERHAYSTLEYVLKKKMEESAENSTKQDKGLKKYLTHAIEAGWISYKGIEIAEHRIRIRQRENERFISAGLARPYSDEQIEDAGRDYLKNLPDHLSKIRNEYSHGSEMIHGHTNSLSALSRCRDLINQLYKAPKTF